MRVAYKAALLFLFNFCNNSYTHMPSKYNVTIGMEVHAELKTNSKMFCACKNDPEEKRPNTNICPVCTGHPGTLPVINQEAVRLVQRVGLAVGGAIQKQTHFDRKNYFYPDLPKGYQISQYQHPLVWGGAINGTNITRVHLEEDTARNIHESDSTLVDFNRSSIPLMELVTEPDLTNAEDARKFCEELQVILQYIGASDANMEKGQMRCEANISIRPEGQKEYGTKVEVKNINSFRAVEMAIQYELKRQEEVLEKGEKVVQETRGWDENKQITFSQRSKESAHDYRYFPEPDLPPLEFTDEYIDGLRGTIPELPSAKRTRLKEEYGVAEGLIEILVHERALSAFWEHMISELKMWEPEKFQEAVTLASNYFTSDLLGLMKEKSITPESLLLEPENFAELIKMIVRGEVSSRVAKDVLRHMVEVGGDPSTIVEDKGLKQVSDTGALEEVAKKVIAANPKPVADYKAGKEQALQALVGQMMKETKGAANPSMIKEILTKNI
jgi:aspartyl-tRNA(Asn)/glutamyl-tRNA(Gln) amidotransferase subunit B